MLISKNLKCAILNFPLSLNLCLSVLGGSWEVTREKAGLRRLPVSTGFFYSIHWSKHYSYCDCEPLFSTGPLWVHLEARILCFTMNLKSIYVLLNQRTIM